MTMERVDNTTIKVSLSRSDLLAQGLKADDLALGRRKSAPLFCRLLGMMSAQTRRQLTAEQVFVEIFPHGDGDCLLYFHLPPVTETRETGQPFLPLVFSFSDIDKLSAAIGAVYQRCRHIVYQSALYRLGSEYRFVPRVYRRLERKVIRICKEYGAYLGCGEIKAAVCAEHGDCLIEENALETLYRCLG